MAGQLKKPDSLNIFELACLRLLEKKIPQTKTEHSQTLLYIMNSCFYKSQQEISLALNLRNTQLEKILDSLAKKRLVHKTGCLYKAKATEEILELF